MVDVFGGQSNGMQLHPVETLGCVMSLLSMKLHSVAIAWGGPMEQQSV